MEIASDSEKLQELAAEWIGMAEGDKSALADRNADLDQQIEGMNASITAVIVATAKQSKSADAIEAATTALNEELQQLQNLRDEAAEWLAEMEESDRRARDLRALASMAKKSFPDMAPEQQAAILSMLELKVTVTGPVPDGRRGGVPCTVRAWYAAADLDVPSASLSDDDWAKGRSPPPEGTQGHRSPLHGCHLLQGAYGQVLARFDQGNRGHPPSFEALQHLGLRRHLGPRKCRLGRRGADPTAGAGAAAPDDHRRAS